MMRWKRLRASFVLATTALVGTAVLVTTGVTASPAGATPRTRLARLRRTTTTLAPTTTTTILPGTTPLFSDDFTGPTGMGWTDGSVHGNWVLTYGANGVELDATKGSNVLSLSPKASTSAGETHASLANSVASFGDLDLSTWLTTKQQLRTPAPNPWEVGWVLWHYTDDTHFYYFLPKTNGWELGKEDPAYPGAQRFLATGSSPAFPVGVPYTVRVRQVGSTMTVWVNGTQIVTFTDSQRPYPSGSLGMYTEDAHVHFDDVVVRAPQ